MTDPTDLVREFHEYFKLPVRDEATLVTGRELELRRTLVNEEHEEFVDELDVPETEASLRRQYKEAADLIYVTYGWDQHAGNLLTRVLNEVHRSNMTKLWDCDGCLGSGEYWIDGLVYGCDDCDGTGKMVRYREDGKVLKPPTYEPPDLSFIPEEPPHAEPAD